MIWLMVVAGWVLLAGIVVRTTTWWGAPSLILTAPPIAVASLGLGWCVKQVRIVGAAIAAVLVLGIMWAGRGILTGGSQASMSVMYLWALSVVTFVCVVAGRGILGWRERSGGEPGRRMDNDG